MSRRFCATCQQCHGYCKKHRRLGDGAGFELEYPDGQCNDFQPDPVRADAISDDDFYRRCATCRFYLANCNIYEVDRYNDSPICSNYEKYHDYDW